MPPRLPLFVASAVALAIGVACGAGGHWSADSSWMGEENNEGRPRDVDTGEAPSAAPSAGPTTAWVGVRHDLMLDPQAAKSARCSCLAVEVGGAKEPKFAWQNTAPDIGGDALAVAVSARGVACPGGNADESKRRASISAVDREANDVVIEIEEVPEGRPIASGAIIPRPGPGGAIYVRGRHATLPYARAVGGHRCKVL